MSSQDQPPGFNQPGYHQPGFNQPGYGHPGGPFPPIRPKEPGGVLPWALGFIAVIPAPVLAQFGAGLTMALVGSKQRLQRGIAGEQGREAANWGITFMVINGVTLLAALVVTLIADQNLAFREDWVWLSPALLVLWAIGIFTHLVVCLIGVIMAVSGRVFRCLIAYPFLRSLNWDDALDPDDGAPPLP